MGVPKWWWGSMDPSLRVSQTSDTLSSSPQTTRQSLLLAVVVVVIVVAVASSLRALVAKALDGLSSPTRIK